VNKYIAQVINLIPDGAQHLWSGDLGTARRALLDADPAAVLAIDGSFALVAQDGERVVLARSLERPLRYFLAKAAEGPVLIVAERIDEIRAELERRGWSDQFHPSYTRMAPAHHVTTLRLIGCPDPNPSYQRFFDPPRGTLPPDLDLIGRHSSTRCTPSCAVGSLGRIASRRSESPSQAASTAARCCSACTGSC